MLDCFLPVTSCDPSSKNYKHSSSACVDLWFISSLVLRYIFLQCRTCTLHPDEWNVAGWTRYNNSMWLGERGESGGLLWFFKLLLTFWALIQNHQQPFLKLNQSQWASQYKQSFQRQSCLWGTEMFALLKCSLFALKVQFQAVQRLFSSPVRLCILHCPYVEAALCVWCVMFPGWGGESAVITRTDMI